MMRLWKESYAQPARRNGAASTSIVTHAVLITAWVISTLPAAGVPDESVWNRVYYIPPPDKPIPSRPSHESVHYISLVNGAGSGDGPVAINARKPIEAVVASPTPGSDTRDSTPTAPPAPEVNADSVYTMLEVDSAVVRSESSAAPAYPLDLLNKHIEGTVVARYVVDTTGFADATSIEILSATNDQFVAAVRDALPYMRFSPAKIGKVKVRQMVQQSFAFHIATAAAVPTKAVKP